MPDRSSYIVWLEDIGTEDSPSVGNKNAFLGEIGRRLYSEGVRTPDGFAVKGAAYRRFLEANGLTQHIRSEIEALKEHRSSVQDVGSSIREMMMDADLPRDVKDEIEEALQKPARRSSRGGSDPARVVADPGPEPGRRNSEPRRNKPFQGDGDDHKPHAQAGGRNSFEGEDRDPRYFAVRTSPTADILAEAAPAGMHDSFPRVRNDEVTTDACLKCYASFFSDRAISFREKHGVEHLEFAPALGIQRTVRSDVGASGTARTLDVDTGFPDLVLIGGTWGLGGSSPDGLLSPDEYVVYRPLLEDRGFEPIIGRTKGAKETKLTSGNRRGIVRVETNDDERGRFVLDDNETLELARWAAAIEDLFEWPVCIEWAKDGLSGELFVVEARPQTVEVKRGRGMLRRYELKSTGEVLVKGTAIGGAAIVGKARIGERLEDAMRIEHGEVLVTRATDPKWLPVMRKARAMIADSNNPGSHADEACRELGLPAVTGTGNACSAIENGEEVTVSCAEGSTGYVYKGRLELEETPLRPEDLPDIHMGIMLNTGSPDAALRWWNVAADGICPARTEFIISNFIGIHPMALLRFDDVRDEDARDKIADMTRGYEDKTEYFIDLLAQNIAQMAASLHPRPVIVRFSDFQGDGYAGLIGGRWFESAERIPAMGLRGASRYVADFYRPAFELECLALKRVRDRMGFSNVGAMIPFCRTPEEADAALEIIESQGLKRTDGGFQVYMMVEVPSNMVSADQLAARFDGLSIAVAGPTGLATGTDRGRDPRTRLSGEMKRAIPNMVLSILNAANDAKIPVGFHAAPLFDDPESVEFLVGAGVNFISVGPDRLANVIERVSAAERPGSIGRLRREK